MNEAFEKWKTLVEITNKDMELITKAAFVAGQVVEREECAKVAELFYIIRQGLIINWVQQWTKAIGKSNR